MPQDLLATVPLALLLGAPVAGTVLAALRFRRPGPALAVVSVAAGVAAVAAVALAAAVVSGARPALGPGTPGLLAADGIAALVAPVVAVVATTVLAYARRNLEGDERAGRFAVAAGALLTGTLVVVTAAGLAVLAAGWVLASMATVALCGYRGTEPARQAASRAARALVTGDLALLGALGLVLAAGGAGFASLGATTDALADRTLLSVGPLRLSAAVAAGALLALAALARAGQLPLPRWLPGTVAAPTPVSALLHAGAVNAGAVLLLRTGPVMASEVLVPVLLAVACLTTLAVALAALRTRPDLKGQLAESTSAQMAFMLLACAVGAPAVALTHLAGHALYKSARFLGAGDAVRRGVARRRWAETVAASPARTRSGGFAVGAAVALGWLLVGAAAGLPAAERWLVGAVLVATAARVGTLLAGRPLAAVRPLALGATVGLAGAAGVALAADRALGDALHHPGAFVDPRVGLAGLLAVVVALVAAERRPAGLAWIAGRTAPVPVRRPAAVAARPSGPPRPLPGTAPVPSPVPVGAARTLSAAADGGR